ncbi:MAG: DCC1-like thiol-disulfide oxidoreductase family protein [Parvularculaceae bacterium]
MRQDDYSYRDDPAVPAFDDAEAILIFDGVCVLCSSGVEWMMRRDPDGATRFLTIQAPLARAIYQHYGLDADAFDTFLVLKDGQPYVKWRGWLEAAKSMPAPWKWLGFAGHVMPRPIGDALYDLIQRNRFDWFGRRATCFAPTPAEQARILSS